MKEIKNLHEKALKVASHYRKSEWQMIEILQEMDQEKVYYYYDCKSLFAYCLKHLKLSESIAYALIRISRKSQQVPELKEKLASGEISTTKAARICSVLKPEKPEHKHSYAKPKGLSLSQVQKNRKYNQNWLKKASSLSSRELEKEIIKEKPQDFSLKESKRALSVDYHSLNLKLGKQEIEALERLKELTRKDTYTEAIKAAADFYIEKKDPLKKQVRKRKTLHVPNTILLRSLKRKKISEATKVALYKREKSKCQKCGTYKNLEIHHSLPISEGGSNGLENLELLCSSCHRKHHFLEQSKPMQIHK